MQNQEQSVQFASVSHGIFICEDCSQYHLQLGEQFTTVRPIASDFWSPQQIEILKFGGNEKFRQFLGSYEIAEFAIQEKYRTLATKYYSMKLECLSKHQTPNLEAPSIDEGKAFISSDEESWVMVKTKEGQVVKAEDFVGDIMFHNDSDDDDYSQYVNRLKQSEVTQSKKNFKEEVKQIWGKASMFGKTQGEKIKTKIQDAHLKEKMQESNVIVKTFFKEKVVDKLRKNSGNEEKPVQKFANKVKLGFSNLFKKKPKNIEFHQQNQDDQLHLDEEHIEDTDANPYIRKIQHNPNVEDIQLDQQIMEDYDQNRMANGSNNFIERELIQEILMNKDSHHNSMMKSEIIYEEHSEEIVISQRKDSQNHEEIHVQDDLEEKLKQMQVDLQVQIKQVEEIKVNLHDQDEQQQDDDADREKQEIQKAQNPNDVQVQQDDQEQEEEEAVDIDDAQDMILLDYDDLKKKEEEQARQQKLQMEEQQQ
eukprot:403363264